MSDGSPSSDEQYDPSNSNNSCLQSPFILYYTVTFSMNGIAIIGGIFSQFDLHRNNYYGFDRCDAWSYANACFGVIHIGAAIYLVKKIREPEKEPAATTTYGDDGNGVFVTGYRLHDPRDNKMSPVGTNTNHDGIATIATTTAATATIAGPPDSPKRIRHVLCENKVFALYIFVFVAYMCWHFFLEMNACNLGMAFAMRCADIFLWAAPCSFAFSVGTMMHQQGRL